MEKNIKTARLIAFCVIASSFIGGMAKADAVNLGKAGSSRPWAILSLETGVVIKDRKNNGTTNVVGNVGSAGSGDVSLLRFARVDGDVFYDTAGTLRITGSSSITGATHQDAATDQDLDDARNDAILASGSASGMTANRPNTNISLQKNQSLTLSGTGTVVLSLRDFVLRKNSTLTLDGTATTNFIVNVSRKFSLKSGNVLLTGGLLESNVLFNVTGTGRAQIRGGSDLSGRILAVNRTISLKQTSIVRGELIGKRVVLSGKSPTVISR